MDHARSEAVISHSVHPRNQSPRRSRLSLACSRAVIVRVQIVYPLVFTNGPLRDRKAVLIAQPSENVPSHHFRTAIILVVEIVVSDGDIAVCWLPILGASGTSRNSDSHALVISVDSDPRRENPPAGTATPL